MRRCEKCDSPTTGTGDRFCKKHRNEVLMTLRKSGYLTPRPFYDNRTQDAKENTYETKYGVNR